MSLHLSSVRATAEGIAYQAGAALRRLHGKTHQESTKRDLKDIVTEGDKAAEAIIIDLLRGAFPTHGIISEEGGGSDAPPDAEYFWHIDPIDGTTNFAADLPLFTVSIGLADRHLRPLVGVVYAPMIDGGEMISAAKGLGTTLNHEPVRVSATDRLDQAVITTGLPYGDDTQTDFDAIRAMQDASRAVRLLGSAALSLAYVAVGRLECFYEHRISSWDVMGGALLITEAGGCVSDFAGDSSDLAYTGKEIVASNGILHDDILTVLRPHFRSSPSR